MNKETAKSKLGIEKGVDMPKYTKIPAEQDDLSLALKIMEIGESKALPVEYDKKKLNSIRTKVDYLKKKQGLGKRKFTTNLDPVSKKTIRIWRVQ